MRTEDELRAAIAAEIRERRQNAKAFAEAAKRGDLERFARFAYPDDALNIDWRMAFREIAKLNTVTPEIHDIFASAWTPHKIWPRAVGDRRALANALRVLMPPLPGQEALTLYRGTDWRERTRRTYLFSWTKDREIARQFAKHWQDSAEKMKAVNARYPVSEAFRVADFGGGVILRVTAPPEAILLDHDGSEYEEREVVVDPFRLRAVSVIERLTTKS